MRITFVCGPSYERWTPDSLKTGVGGSETAVIRMAEELHKLGHSVEVYNDSEGGDFNGVSYFNFNTKLPPETDIMICWRTPGHVMSMKGHMKYEKAFLWLHDVVPQKEVLPYIHFYDKILVLSKFHRAVYYDVPDDKFFVTRNGIGDGKTQAAFGLRDPFKLAYFSSYDRGLKILLENWTALKLSFPKLSLVIGYGWDTLERLDPTPQIRIFRDYMDNLFDQEGITHLGRVSQKEVDRQLSESQFLAYPCIYPETSCIVAMQAQAQGAVPVVIPTGALQETVAFGYKTADSATSLGRMNDRLEDEWVSLLFDALRKPEETEKIRQKMVPWARKRLSWEAVAKEWDGIF